MGCWGFFSCERVGGSRARGGSPGLALCASTIFLLRLKISSLKSSEKEGAIGQRSGSLGVASWPRFDNCVHG